MQRIHTLAVNALAIGCLGWLATPVAGEAQQVLLDEGVQAGDLMVFPTMGSGYEASDEYYYVHNSVQLARSPSGEPEFSFLRFVDNVRPEEGVDVQREGEGGGIVHAVVQLAVEESTLREAENELGRLRPGARIVGPVIYRSGTFGLVSSFLEEDGEWTRRVVGLGKAPVLEGSRAAVSIRLTKQGSKILWESFRMPTPDVSFRFEMEVAGLRSPTRVLLEADWDRVYNQQAFQVGIAGTFLAGEVSGEFDKLRNEGAIRIVQVGTDEDVEKAVDLAYNKLLKIMFEPVGGSDLPGLEQLARRAGQTSMLDRASQLLASARAESRSGGSRAAGVANTVARGARVLAQSARGSGANSEAADSEAVEPEGTGESEPAEDSNEQKPAQDSSADSSADSAEQEAPETGAADPSPEDSAEQAPAENQPADAGDTARTRAYMKAIFDHHHESLSIALREYLQGAESLPSTECLEHESPKACEVSNLAYAGARQGHLHQHVIPTLRQRLDSGPSVAGDIESSLLAEAREDERTRDLGSEWTRTIKSRLASLFYELAADSLMAIRGRRLESEEITAEDQAAIDQTFERWMGRADEHGAHLESGVQRTRELANQLGVPTDFPDLETAPDMGPWLSEHVGGGPGGPPRYSQAEMPGGGGEEEARAVADAEKRGPPPGGADAGGGAGGGGGAGAGEGAARVRQPSFAVVGALRLRRSRQSGTFRLDMNKYSPDVQVIPFDSNIGDLNRYLDNPEFFREVNLDQPLFRQRAVSFRLAGLDAEDFGEYVNFVHVQLRRGADTREELTVGAEEFSRTGNDYPLIYGFSGEESRDEWLGYEYRTVWSFFNGLEVEQPWQPGEAGAVALAPPLVRRQVEVTANPEDLREAGARAVTVRLYYGEGDQERFSEVLLRPDREVYAGLAEVILPAGEPEFEYETLWQLRGNQEVNSGRLRASSSILFIDEVPNP